MKKFAGWLILLAFFALMLLSSAAKHGWGIAIATFVAALVSAGLICLAICLAVWLIYQE